MANRFGYSDVKYYDPKIVEIHGSFIVDSTQTSNTANYKCSSVTGSGIANILNVATGVYKVVLQDNYFHFNDISFSSSGLLGTPVAIASLSNTVPYVISTIGTSAQADWVLAGMDSGITAALGVAFVAGSSASSATGNGYAAPIITAAGNDKFQLFGNPETTINPAVGSSPYFMFQTLSPTNSSTTTMIAAIPTDQTIIRFRLRVRNTGAIKGKGE
jgi:hypothetical protein